MSFFCVRDRISGFKFGRKYALDGHAVDFKQQFFKRFYYNEESDPRSVVNYVFRKKKVFVHNIKISLDRFRYIYNQPYRENFVLAPLRFILCTAVLPNQDYIRSGGAVEYHADVPLIVPTGGDNTNRYRTIEFDDFYNKDILPFSFPDRVHVLCDCENMLDLKQTDFYDEKGFFVEQGEAVGFYFYFYLNAHDRDFIVYPGDHTLSLENDYFYASFVVN